MGRRKAGEQLDVERLLLMAKEGATLVQMAEALGVTERSVSRYKQALGLTQCQAGFRQLPEGWKDQAEDLFNEGYSQMAVAELVGVSAGTVARYFPGRGWNRSEVGSYARQATVLRRLVA
jgi:predicted transcriptional regulator